jgi:hypothetical protein
MFKPALTLTGLFFRIRDNPYEEHNNIK